MSDEREDYDALIKSPGWLRLLQATKEHWDKSLSDQIAACTSDRDENVALQKLRQVVAAQRAVQQLIEFPSRRIAQLAGANVEQPVRLSRGGL